MCLSVYSSSYLGSFAGVTNLQPMGCMRPRVAMNWGQHKIVNLFKMFRDFVCVITCHHVFNMWPRTTTTLLPVQSRDAKRLDTPL